MTAGKKGEFMDVPQIMRELGFNETQATKIIRWCFEEKGRGLKIEPPEGRKTFAYREDVMDWVARHQVAA